MIGEQDRWQEDLFVAGPLRELVPDDHILKQVDSAVDFSWVEDEVRETYCEDNGRPGIAPETALRLRIPLRRFKYDSKHKRVRCPAGKVLQPSRRVKNGTVYRAAARDCAQCPLRKRCFSETAYSRTVLIVDSCETLLRARRKSSRGTRPGPNARVM